MTIEEIVLDGKKIEEDMEMLIRIHGVSAKKKIVRYIKKLIAKSISDKIKAVSIDRDELDKILSELITEISYDVISAKFNIYHPHYHKRYHKFADNILSLLKPVKTLNEKQVKEILETMLMSYKCGLDEINEIYFGEAKKCKNDKVKLSELGKKSLIEEKSNMESAIEYGVKKICGLAIREVKPKNISNEELNREIKKYLKSFSKEEWRKKLEEEKYLYELDKEERR